MSLDTALTSLQDRLTEYKAARQRIADIVLDGIKALVSDDSSIRYIAIKGWTPGFNDGEPCTHSQEVSVNGLGLSYGGKALPADFVVIPVGDTCREQYHEDGYEDNDPIPAPYDALFVKDESITEDVLKVIKTLDELESILEHVLGTDWCFVAWRDADGNTQHRVGSYDCGH